MKVPRYTDLRELARGQRCQVRIPGVCVSHPETVVLAHFRMIGVSGLGLKPPDLLGAHACSACHSYVDTHHDDETQLAFAKGVFRTQAWYVKQNIVAW
jgi:hypothetical protein